MPINTSADARLGPAQSMGKSQVLKFKQLTILTNQRRDKTSHQLHLMLFTLTTANYDKAQQQLMGSAAIIKK